MAKRRFEALSAGVSALYNAQPAVPIPGTEPPLPFSSA
jgi:hypothetical protein